MKFRFTTAEQEAFDTWAAGLIVGCIPLIAHGAVWVGSDGITNWTAELLIVLLSNCGFSVVTCAIKAIRRDPRGSPMIGWLVAITTGFLIVGAALYGQVAVGNHRHINFWSALILVILSCFPSIYLDYLLASQPLGQRRRARAG